MIDTGSESSANTSFQRDPNDVKDFDLQNEIIALSNVLHQIDHRLGQMYETIESNNVKLEMLEEAVSQSTYIPYLPLVPRYDHKTNQLILHKRLLIQYKGNEAELLSMMFTKSTHKVKKQIFYYAEVADELNMIRAKNLDKLLSPKSVLQTITRIRDGLELEHRAGRILIITSKDFRFNPHL